MKKHLLITITVLFVLAGKAQETQLLDSLALDGEFAYTSIAEAMVNPDKVIRLELDKKKLKVFPSEIFKMKNLQYLSISKNNLREIPDSLDMLPNLQYFNASRNKIEIMPNSIGKMKELRWLIWNNNNLGSLPHGIGNLEKLEYLDLWSNDLSFFPETMKNMKSLKVLDLRVILMNQDVQDKLHELMPNVNIFMDRACNCK